MRKSDDRIILSICGKNPRKLFTSPARELIVPQESLVLKVVPSFPVHLSQ